MFIISHLAMIGWDENIWLFTKELNMVSLNEQDWAKLYAFEGQFLKSLYRNYIFICRKKMGSFLPCNCTCCIKHNHVSKDKHAHHQGINPKYMPWVKVKVIEFEISQKCVVYTCRWVKLLNSYLRRRNILIVSEDVLILSHL